MSFGEYFGAMASLGDAYQAGLDRYELKKNQLDAARIYGDQLSGLTAAQPSGNALASLGQPVAVPPPAPTSRSLPTFAQGSDIGRYASAIQSNESGGRYDIVGPTHPKYGRALGAYQVMESNLPSWSREALGREVSPDEFLRSPQIQDAVFQKKFGQAVAKYGNPQDAASVWFTGRPLAQGANARDVLGTTGQRYVDKFTSALGRTAGRTAPSLPATVAQMPGAPGQQQVASADPAQADMPMPGAVPAGFRIPGQAAAEQSDFVPGSVASPAVAAGNAALPAPTAGTPRVSPQQAEQLRRMLANPVTAPQAQAIIAKLSAPSKFEVKELGGRVVRVDDGGNISAVPGFEKPPSLKQFKGSDGNDYLLNEATGETRRLIEGREKGFTDLVAPEDRAAAGVPASFTGPVQRGPNGELKFPGKPSTEVNIDQKGETAFAQTSNTAIAKRFEKLSEEGDAARAEGALLNQLSGLGGVIGTGPLAATRAWLADNGVKLGDNIGAVEAYGSLVDKLVPAQRVPGSGTTSDFDAKGFKASLPRLMNTPEGNKLIIGTLQALNEYKVQRAAIAERALTGEIKPAEAIRQLSALPSPNTAFRSGLSELQKSGKLAADAMAPSGSATPIPGAPAVGFEKGGYRYKGGDPANPSSWARIGAP